MRSFLLFCFLAIWLAGCAGLKHNAVEVAKNVIGISTKEVEEVRPDAIKKTFNLGFNDCYRKTLKAMQVIGAYVYAKDPQKKMIAAYISPEDTTVFGVFFKELDASTTEVEVASPSTFAKESVAAKLFWRLEKTDAELERIAAGEKKEKEAKEKQDKEKK